MTQPTVVQNPDGFFRNYVVCNSQAILKELMSALPRFNATRDNKNPVIYLSTDQMELIGRDENNRVFPCLVDGCQKKNFRFMVRYFSGPLALLSQTVCPIIYTFNVGDDQSTTKIAVQIAKTIAPAIN
jgi:hypothetical protein